ncbi:hypothetical protein JQ579_03770 [Bradyrhizobium ottawaense]|uniref:IS110 family transposase n=1 Tax=Bradyrhizobium ottawaense TaxID=931866 RepID=A0A2U8P2P8_9BRAD|nr:hypothetical protein CIT37_06940 [Bradyrhizobium ottawaense]MBR1325887.1 hypothetical protein [Bradyrhizobium ottawaense]MBR1331778.1 hypothetical protein [Bradyrhizobium ottawaense]
MTAPGVGPVAALSFKVGVDDPHRFARSKTVGARILAWRRGGTSPAHRSITKDASANEATSPYARRFARRPQACCCGSGMIGTAGMGPADRQTVEHAVRDHRGGTEAGKHSAPDVG